MNVLFRSPLDLILPPVLLILAFLAARNGSRRFIEGVRDPDHPHGTLRVVRGFRGWITAIALVSFACGVLCETRWPILFALIFLGEELLETGFMVWVLRRQTSLVTRSDASSSP